MFQIYYGDSIPVEIFLDFTFFFNDGNIGEIGDFLDIE